MLVLDSGAVTTLARRSPASLAAIRALRERGLWPPIVPSVVLVECLTGDAGRDAPVNRLLRACEVAEHLPAAGARRAAALRTRAGRGSAVDAVVAAHAEPGGVVLTGDRRDIGALAAHAHGVRVEHI